MKTSTIINTAVMAVSVFLLERAIVIFPTDAIIGLLCAVVGIAGFVAYDLLP